MEIIVETKGWTFPETRCPFRRPHAEYDLEMCNIREGLPVGDRMCVGLDDSRCPLKQEDITITLERNNENNS